MVKGDELHSEIMEFYLKLELNRFENFELIGLLDRWLDILFGDYLRATSYFVCVKL